MHNTDKNQHEKASGAPEAPKSELKNCPRCGTHWTKHLWATFEECDHKRLFIPDNSGGGTWETWKDDRPKAEPRRYDLELKYIERAERAEASSDLWKAMYVDLKANAEALAEALRGMMDAFAWKSGATPVGELQSDVRRARAALAKWEQGQ